MSEPEFETCTYCKREYPFPVALNHSEDECDPDPVEVLPCIAAGEGKIAPGRTDHGHISDLTPEEAADR